MPTRGLTLTLGFTEVSWTSGRAALLPEVMLSRSPSYGWVRSGAFFQRRTFYRYLCFLGGLSANYGRTGMVGDHQFGGRRQPLITGCLSLNDIWEDHLVRDSRTSWENTTHDWAVIVDHEHIAQNRERSATYAPGGVKHLILEVLAYAADEAESAGRAGRAIVTMHADGSVSVADDGRGTDTRVNAAGRVIKKPVMGTKDLRF